jgi:hypothetical protein
MVRKRFSFRTFTSFILAWAFLALIVSGAVLYIAPPGRIANWTRWQIILLTKEQWQAVHTLTAVTFLVGGIFHLLKFNWKAFLAYLRKKTGGSLAFRRELIASGALFLLVLAGTISRQPPFQSVMAAGEAIRQYWEEPSQTPPIPHMEEMTLSQLAENLDMEAENLIKELEGRGYAAAGMDETLRQLAQRHQSSPNVIYTSLTGSAPPAPTEHKPAFGGGGGGGGRGQGFKTLAQFAAENGISAEDAVRILARSGIEAGADELMRNLAERSGRKPYELLEMLQK